MDASRVHARGGIGPGPQQRTARRHPQGPAERRHQAGEPAPGDADDRERLAVQHIVRPTASARRRAAASRTRATAPPPAAPDASSGTSSRPRAAVTPTSWKVVAGDDLAEGLFVVGVDPQAERPQLKAASSARVELRRRSSAYADSAVFENRFEYTRTNVSASATGSGRRKNAFARLKTVAFAPIPSASTATAIRVNPGVRRARGPRSEDPERAG